MHDLPGRRVTQASNPLMCSLLPDLPGFRLERSGLRVLADLAQHSGQALVRFSQVRMVRGKALLADGQSFPGRFFRFGWTVVG